jgi:hypothetical protein
MAPRTADVAAVERGGAFWSSGSGKWAGEQLLKALKSGKMTDFSPAALRTCDTLSKDEWKVYDDAVIRAATLRLQAVGDLVSAGLTISLPNAMGKTVYEYEKLSDMLPANISLDGMTRGENDTQEVSLAGLPIPITHKDFFLNLRHLMASRNRGEGLDVTQSRTAGRLVGESIEQQLVQGGRVFGGLPTYGYLTHPQRNLVSFGTGGSWSQAAKTGDNMLVDVQTMMSIMEADRQWGPYWLYTPRDANVKLQGDFKANSDKSIMTRLKEMDNLAAVKALDFLPTGNLIMVNANIETVALLDGEPIQTVQWDINGGFGLNFKAFAIQVPLVRSDSEGRSGIVHMS